MPRKPEQFKEIRERTKRQILNAGFKVFATKGYHGASIADIAKEAGISKGLAYNYFGSKLELAEAVLSDLEKMMEPIEELFQTITDPYEILEASIKITINHVKENEEFWRLYISFVSQIEIAELAKQIFGKIADKYLKQYTKIFKQIGVKNPKAEAYILAAILDGVPIDYIFYKERYPLNAILKQLLIKYSKEGLDKLK